MIIFMIRIVFRFILVEEHFASVENHILSDIRSYHMKVDKEIEEENQWEKDQYVISRFIPERESWSLRTQVNDDKDKDER